MWIVWYLNYIAIKLLKNEVTFTILESVYTERGQTRVQTVSSCRHPFPQTSPLELLVRSSCPFYDPSQGLKSLVPRDVSRFKELSLAFDPFLSKKLLLSWLWSSVLSKKTFGLFSKLIWMSRWEKAKAPYGSHPSQTQYVLDTASQGCVTRAEPCLLCLSKEARKITHTLSTSFCCS